ncbi:hypothetical protein F0L68_29215 [Solihabitans fulvus]|uniref:Uncharacterized protein n=1 Tax=Solihabitans fulvus TaxID=1892852 RepID=A0A5B2WTF0_9PSEU|nr:hypothetical protein [Solihabitans fulvus]KAA2254865.1 hypothetical protein F0L68_29215 [Solihabitans fulvus]
MTGVLRDLLIVAVVTAAACLAVRIVLPWAVRTVTRPLQDAIDFLTACLLLPEYWVSAAARRTAGRPPRLAYEYGFALGWLASVLCTALDRLCRTAARAGTSVHPVLVAVLASGLSTGRILCWL